MLQSPIPIQNKVRLVALYSLRYERHPQNALAVLLDLLGVHGVPQNSINTIKSLLRYASSVQQQEDLFESESIFSRARSGFKGLKGVENVYTQHSPRLEQTITNLAKGRLREQTHPFVEGSPNTREKPQDIIVFIAGGATYEEAKTVAQINASTPGVRVVLGGTSIMNSSMFLKEVEDVVGSWPAPEGRTAEERLRNRV
jgi:vacuolar protein sorting-associated protein 45